MDENVRELFHEKRKGGEKGMKRTAKTMICREAMIEENREKYKKALSANRPRLSSHNRMPRINRAAQFAPFAALTGLEDAFQEEERDTELEKILSEEAWSELEYTLQELLSEEGQPVVKVTYFQPALTKDGGNYKEVFGKLLGVDGFNRELSLSGGIKIHLDRISEVNYPPLR